MIAPRAKGFFSSRFAEKLPALAGLSLSICSSATLCPSRNIQPRQYQPVSTFLTNRRVGGHLHIFFSAPPKTQRRRNPPVTPFLFSIPPSRDIFQTRVWHPLPMYSRARSYHLTGLISVLTSPPSHRWIWATAVAEGSTDPLTGRTMAKVGRRPRRRRPGRCACWIPVPGDPVRTASRAAPLL